MFNVKERNFCKLLHPLPSATLWFFYVPPLPLYCYHLPLHMKATSRVVRAQSLAYNVFPYVLKRSFQKKYFLTNSGCLLQTVCVLLWVWLLWLCMMFSRLIRVVSHISTSFLIVAEYSVEWIYHSLFIHLLMKTWVISISGVLWLVLLFIKTDSKLMVT